MNIVFDGDSIALGVGASPSMTLSNQVERLLKYKFATHVVAQGGRQLSECLDTFDSHVSISYDLNARLNIVFLKAGDNDITRGISAETTYRHLKTYVGLAQSCGWKIIVASNLQRFDVSDERQAELSLFNNFIMRNEAGADIVIDFASDTIIGSIESRKNSTYYNEDGVHPTDAGYSILARKIVYAINHLI